MSIANSSSSFPAHRVTAHVPLQQNRPVRVFQTDLFDRYVGRVVRKHIAEQFVDADHQVLVDEDRLIAESEKSLREHLAQSVPEWKTAWRLAKVTIVQHIRHLARQRLRLHEVDDETRDAALEAIFRDDFERLFPASWADA